MTSLLTDQKNLVQNLTKKESKVKISLFCSTEVLCCSINLNSFHLNGHKKQGVHPDIKARTALYNIINSTT